MVSSESFKRILKSMNSSESNFFHAGILLTPKNLTKHVVYRVQLGSYILCLINYVQYCTFYVTFVYPLRNFFSPFHETLILVL